MDDLSRPSIAVCVPLRDEARRLPTLLDALSRQEGLEERAFVACFLFDGCRDQGERLLAREQSRLPFPVLAGSIARLVSPNAGRARRAALALGLRATRGMPRALLLTTDADSRPADDWISRNLEALGQVDLVAGYIRRQRAGSLPIRLRHENYLERLHRLRRTLDPIPYDPLPSHPSLGGASLAFRAGVYRQLGGFRPLPQGEDVDLVAKARQAGFRVRHDRAVKVLTSGRIRGRAEGGLADELRLAREAKQERAFLPEVEHPAEAAALFQRQALARQAFACRDRRDVAERLSGLLALPAPLIAETLRAAPNAEAFTMRLAGSEAIRRRIALPLAEGLLSEIEINLGVPA